MHLSETILLISFLLAMGIIAASLVRKASIPYTVFLVFIGIGVGELSRHWMPLASFGELTLTPELVLFVFLPVLIFESGVKLDARQLVKDIVPVLTLAIPALLLSTAIIGFALWMILPIQLATSLLFGALISATDPVAVISLFKELGTPQRLTVLVEGESLMNDATAIVLFNILLGMALFGGGGVDAILPAVGDFFRVFVGGGLLGAVFGSIASYLIIRLAFKTEVIMTLLLVVTYGVFILAEHYLHLSGVMAVAVCAIFLGILGIPKLTQNATAAVYEIWDFLALVANTLLFILVGTSVHIERLVGRWDLMLIAIVLVMVARASVIYPLVPLTVKMFNLPRVSMGERHIMWWGGLKGGLAIAIVLSIPDDMMGKDLLLDMTLGVVVFTLVVNAPTIRPLINRLGINRMNDQEKEELLRGSSLVQDNARQTLKKFLDAGVVSRSNFYRVEKSIKDMMQEPERRVGKEQDILYARLMLLSREMQELGLLFQGGVIQQYTFLDLKGEVRRKREHLISGIRSDPSIKARKANLFLRFEDAIIRFLRERDFAAGMLAHYQNIRISHHLIKDVARILMTKAALAHLQDMEFLSKKQIEEIRDSYMHRLSTFTRNIKDTQRNFPEFYKRFETRFSLRAALAGGLNLIEHEMENGGIGAKAYAKIERVIEEELKHVPPITTPVTELAGSELIGMISLFQGLPDDVISEIANGARAVSFLVDDTIIEQGERGNAVYVIVRGEVGVYRRDKKGVEEQVSVLRDGDFFGETALLSDSIRTATVRALRECTLLRITRKTVMEIADRFPVVSARLDEERQAREI